MRFLLFSLSLLFVFLTPVRDQSKLAKAPAEGLKLGDPMADFSESVYLLTGDEDLYRQYDFMREALLKNINNGIREGIYVGETTDLIEDKKATKLSLFFYKEELYKVRWLFIKNDYPDIESLTQSLDQFLENKYGSPTEVIPIGPYELKTWKDTPYYLQSMGDEEEYQIEYRNELVHQKVEALE